MHILKAVLDGVIVLLALLSLVAIVAMYWMTFT